MSDLTYETLFAPPMLPLLAPGTIQDLFAVDADALPELREDQFADLGAAWCRPGTPGAFQEWPPPDSFHDNIGLAHKLGADALEMVGWNAGRPLYRYVPKKRRNRKGWPRIYNSRSRRNPGGAVLKPAIEATPAEWDDLLLADINPGYHDNYQLSSYDGNFSFHSDGGSTGGSPHADAYSTTNTLYLDTTDYGDDFTLEVEASTSFPVPLALLRPELRRMRVAATDKRCRRCPHVSVTYVDFLAHARIHKLAPRHEKCCVPSCPMLEIGFTRLLDLRWHYYDCHFEKGQVADDCAAQALEIESKMYCCPELGCSRFFYRRDSLIRHIRKVHQLDDAETLRLMQKTYPYQHKLCTTCKH